MKPWIDIMQVASLQAELAMVQAQLADRHAAVAAHLQQQQHPQMGAGLSSSAAAGQAAYMQQFEQQSDQLNIPPTSALSMSLASGSGSPAAAHNYLRIKEEGRHPTSHWSQLCPTKPLCSRPSLWRSLGPAHSRINPTMESFKLLLILFCDGPNRGSSPILLQQPVQPSSFVLGVSTVVSSDLVM
jgi:hypothetical protein